VPEVTPEGILRCAGSAVIQPWARHEQHRRANPQKGPLGLRRPAQIMNRCDERVGHMHEHESNSPLAGKVVLITGGTGSFGRKFAQIVLKRCEPQAIRIYSRGELLQQQMREQFENDPRLRFFIGDVRDRSRLCRAMHGVDVVVHAAALKQVPACEYNPIEAVRTNVDGTANVIDAAIDNNVEKVVGISTDKAVHPVNLYGATKLVAEKLLVQGNAYAGGGRTRFSVVRYGNVMGSRGSVVPLFTRLRNSGRLPITDPRMTRFSITLEQGVDIVVRCLQWMVGGETFVPKLPSVRVIDLAKAIAPNCELEVVGIRPGEKLHEILIPEDEARNALEYDDHFIVLPQDPEWDFARFERGMGAKVRTEGFEYTSANNTAWLTPDELRAMIEDVGSHAGDDAR